MWTAAKTEDGQSAETEMQQRACRAVVRFLGQKFVDRKGYAGDGLLGGAATARASAAQRISASLLTALCEQIKRARNANIPRKVGSGTHREVGRPYAPRGRPEDQPEIVALSLFPHRRGRLPARSGWTESKPTWRTPSELRAWKCLAPWPA
jgi:hypothetical protein